VEPLDPDAVEEEEEHEVEEEAGEQSKPLTPN